MDCKKVFTAVKILGSYGLTILLLFALIVITIWGTLEQGKIGLFQAQQQYFHAFISFLAVGPLTIPFIGGYSIFILLFINLICAFFTRLRCPLGMLICHFGILTLFVGSFLAFHYSQEGQIILSQKQQITNYTSYHNYELLVKDDTALDFTHVIAYPQKLLADGQILQRPSSPLRIRVLNYYQSCIAIRSNEVQSGIFRQHDFQLIAIAPQQRNMHSRPGCVLQISQHLQPLGKVCVWAYQPLTFSSHGRKYIIELKKASRPLPFSLELLHFRRELHPGTSIPKHFESKVIIHHDNLQRQALISMNRPLRYQGYTFYQSSYKMDKKQYQSILSVVKNPARSWPYFSCLLIFVGMLIHFLHKMFHYLRTRGAV